VSVRLQGPDGNVYDIPEEMVDHAVKSEGFKPIGGTEAAAGFETTPAPADTVADKVAAGISSGLSTATFGASDVATGLLTTKGQREALDRAKRENTGSVVLGTLAGAITDPFGAGSAASRLSRSLARTEEATSLAGKLARSGAAGVIEGGAMGAGQGAGEVALSPDDLSVEQAASVIGSNMLFGGAAGGAVGLAGKGIELGLGKAKGALDKYAAREADAAATGSVGDDLTKLDRKGLRAAEKTELDAIEAARVPRRAQVADEIQSFRKELKESKFWLATKDSEVPGVRALGARTRKADMALDRLLDDPKALAEAPKAALKHLRVQEAALEDLNTNYASKLRETFAGDTSGARAAALDYVPTALEKNRALQAKIAELSGKATSPRLDAIGDAMAGLGQATKKESATIGDILGQSAMGHAVGALAGVPYLGQAVLAAKAAGAVMKKLGANAGEVAARGSQAISKFLDVGSKVARPAPIVASKVLSSVRFGEGSAPSKIKKASGLANDYHARANELRSLTMPGPDGAPVMRTEARAKIAERLAPVRAANPLLADRIETNKAAAYAFLAGKLPRKPDLPGMGMNDGWQPSDMEMRGFARYVAAVEDPHGIVERLVSGDITPEDADAMRSVYPEMYAQVQREIMGQLGELRAQLPYKRRLALSIFSGIAVDPAMDPRVLSILQGTFAAEEGSAGGTQAPRAQPQFGSVSKPEPTPAQERAG
jgi:hypothetical protein